LDGHIDLEGAFFYGLGAGYNLNEHFNLNTQLMFGSPDAELDPGLFSDPTIEDDADVFRWDINLDWNILERRLTPVVSGGLGYINADMFGESQGDISYNVGVGVRWDVDDNLLVKAMLNFMWTELDTDETWLFTSIGVSVGWCF
jgi:hypothetical protein